MAPSKANSKWSKFTLWWNILEVNLITTNKNDLIFSSDFFKKFFTAKSTLSNSKMTFFKVFIFSTVTDIAASRILNCCSKASFMDRTYQVQETIIISYSVILTDFNREWDRWTLGSTKCQCIPQSARRKTTEIWFKWCGSWAMAWQPHILMNIPRWTYGLQLTRNYCEKKSWNSN